MEKPRGILARLFGMLAILGLSAMQQPAQAETPQDFVCGGSAGCYACVVEHPDGGSCIIWDCGYFWTDCFE